MRITVQRYSSETEQTRSLIFVDGVFWCYGIEDEAREVKVAGKTRIPAGVYQVGLRTGGSMHPRYLQRYPDDHKGMLWVKDVIGYTWIYIHIGNTHEHTEGCLLVGQGVNTQGSVSHSAMAYHPFYCHVVAAAEAGELTIEYIDEIPEVSRETDTDI